jgi:hypothetical protein
MRKTKDGFYDQDRINGSIHTLETTLNTEELARVVRSIIDRNGFKVARLALDSLGIALAVQPGEFRP